METTAGGTPGAARVGHAEGPQPRPPAAPRYSGVTDAVGIAVLVCCAVWALVAASGRQARPEGTLLALLAVTAGYAAGRIMGALLPVVAPAAAAAAVLGLVLLPSLGVGVPARADTPALGHGSADAALLVLAAGAACCAACAARGRARRAGLRLIGAAAAAAALLPGSVAGCVAGAAVVVCSLAAVRTRRRVPGLVALALAAAVAVGGSYAVAVDALPSPVSQPLSGRLTPSRIELWHEAVVLAEQHPLRGVGPERFPGESTMPPSEVPPGPQSPQSAPLQLAAEQGVPGAALLAVAYGWVLCALWRSSRPTPVVLTAGAALTGIALLATVDQVLSYAVVTAGAGFLAGVATARPLTEDSDTSDNPTGPNG
jgi:O-antigen ligase